MTINNKNTVYFLLVIAASLFVNCKNSKELENIQNGEKLFTSVGCATCHSVTGEKRYGPKLNDILRTETNVIRNGEAYTFIIDRNYIQLHRTF